MLCVYFSVSSNEVNLFSMILRCPFHNTFSSSNIARHFIDSFCFILCLLIFKCGNRKRNSVCFTSFLEKKYLTFLMFRDSFIIVRSLFTSKNAYIYIHIYIYIYVLYIYVRIHKVYIHTCQKTWDSLADSDMIFLQGNF